MCVSRSLVMLMVFNDYLYIVQLLTMTINSGCEDPKMVVSMEQLEFQCCGKLHWGAWRIAKGSLLKAIVSVALAFQTHIVLILGHYCC